MVDFSIIKSKARIEFILPCVVAILLPLIAYWQILHFITFSQPGLPFWEYINSGPTIAQSPQAGVAYPFNVYWIFWFAISVLKLNVHSIDVLPKLMIGFISILSSYFYLRSIILRGFPRNLRKDTLAIVLASLAGSIIYFFGIASFDAWAGMAIVYSLLPLFGLLILIGYDRSLKQKLLFLLFSSFIWVLVVALYPLAIITYLLPLLVNYLVIRFEKKQKLMPFLYVLFAVVFMLILGFPVISSYMSSNVTNPEVWSLPQIGRKFFLNSGNTVANLFVSQPDPWLSESVHNKPSISFALQLFIPILSFGYLLFLRENLLRRKLSLILTMIATTVIGLYTISFPNLQGQPLLVVLGSKLPGPLSTIAINLLGEFRVPEQILPFLYSILISFTIYSVLNKVFELRFRIKFVSTFRIKVLSTILLFLMIATLGFSSYNLYTGYGGTDISSYATVASSDLAVTNYILGVHPTGCVIWIPHPPLFQFLLYGGNNLITYTFGDDGPSSTWYLDYVVGISNSLIEKGEIEDAAVFLSEIGVEYVAISSQSSINGSNMFTSSAFTLAYRSGDSYLFRNNYYIVSWASNNIIYVAGGLNTYEQMLPYLNVVKYNYTNPVFYLDREPLPNLHTTNGAYLFSQTSNIYDLVVPLMTDDLRIVPSQYASQTKGPQQDWTINSVTNIGLTSIPWNDWINADPSYEWQYTYQLNDGIAYTNSTNPSSLVIPFKMSQDGQYNILIRYYVGPDSKGLNLSINGQSHELNDCPTGANGFVWNAVPVTLSQGSNNLSIISGGGLAAVNLIEIVDQRSLSEALSEASQLLSDAPQFYALNLNQCGNSLLNFSLISSGNYSIYLQKQDTGFLGLTFQSNNGQTVTQWTGNGTGVFEIGSADFQNQFSLNVTSISSLNGTTILLRKSPENFSPNTYTVFVDPILFSFPYKTTTFANFTLQAYPAYGMSTAFILPVNITLAEKLDSQYLQRYLQP